MHTNMMVKTTCDKYRRVQLFVVGQTVFFVSLWRKFQTHDSMVTRSNFVMKVEHEGNHEWNPASKGYTALILVLNSSVLQLP